MSQPGVDTAWDRGYASPAGCAKYNERFGLAPLDRPGSEDYFRALMTAERRRAEGFGARRAVKERKLPPVKVTRSADPTPQSCDACGRFLASGAAALAHSKLPAVVCAAHASDGTRLARPTKDNKFTWEPVTIAVIPTPGESS